MENFSSILTPTPPPTEYDTLKDLVIEYIEAHEKYTSTLRYEAKKDAESLFMKLKAIVIGSSTGSLTTNRRLF